MVGHDERKEVETCPTPNAVAKDAAVTTAVTTITTTVIAILVDITALILVITTSAASAAAAAADLRIIAGAAVTASRFIALRSMYASTVFACA